MHIGQVIDSLEIGGAQTLQITLAKELMKRGENISVISLRKNRNLQIVAELNSLGVKVITEPSTRLLDLQRIKHLSKIIKYLQIEILQTHLTYANIIGPLAGRLAHVPVIATIHNEFPDPGFNNRSRYFLETLMIKTFSKAIIAVGKKVQDTQQKRFSNKKLFIFPNAVHIPATLTIKQRSEGRKKMVGNPNSLILISVGRLSPQKAFLDLIDTFKIVHQHLPISFLLIAGGGGERENIQSKIEQLHLEKNIILLGERSDIPYLFGISDIYVSSAHWEGLPVAVLEAMASGLPVIATCVGDLPNIIIDGTGFLVPPKRPDLLADKIIDLLSDKKRLHEFGANSRHYISQNHEAGAWAEEILSLYKGILNQTDNTVRLVDRVANE